MPSGVNQKEEVQCEEIPDCWVCRSNASIPGNINIEGGKETDINRKWNLYPVHLSEGRQDWCFHHALGKAGVLTLCVALFAEFSSHYVKRLSPLQVYFENDSNWDYPINAQRWGTLQSVTSLPAILIPIVGGFAFDSVWGPKMGMTIFLFLVATGQLIFLFSIHQHVYGLALLGRFIYGLGQGSVSSLTTATIAMFFRSRLVFYIGVSESVHAISGVLAKATSAYLADITGCYATPMIIGSIATLIAVAVSFMWYRSDTSDDLLSNVIKIKEGSKINKQDKQTKFQKKCSIGIQSPLLSYPSGDLMEVERVEDGLPIVENMKISSVEGVSSSLNNKNNNINNELVNGHSSLLSTLNKIALSRSFWIIFCLHCLFSGTHRVFGHFDATFLRQGYGYDPIYAGYLASTSDAFEIIAAPFLGYYLDKKCSKFRNVVLPLIVSLTCLISAFAYLFLSLGCSWKSSYFHDYPFIYLLLLSFCNGITPTILRSSVPSTIQYDKSLLGTAYGLYEVSESTGVFLGGFYSGVLALNNGNYNMVLIIFSCVLIGSSILSVYLAFVQYNKKCSYYMKQ